MRGSLLHDRRRGIEIGSAFGSAGRVACSPFFTKHRVDRSHPRPKFGACALVVVVREKELRS
jgi:hypothetical protein